MMLLDGDSINELQKVHPVLSATFLTAYGRYKAHCARVIRVTETLRTRARQEHLLREGKTKTLASAHLDGLALDIAILTPDRKTALWDFELYREFNGMMQAAFRPYQLYGYAPRLIWGGDWKTLRDGVHWELSGFDPTFHTLY